MVLDSESSRKSRRNWSQVRMQDPVAIEHLNATRGMVSKRTDRPPSAQLSSIDELAQNEILRAASGRSGATLRRMLTSAS